MTRAYSELYLDDAMRNLGEAMEHAVHGYGMDPDRFMTIFIVSGISNRFASGDPRIVSGMSGTEIVEKTMEKMNIATGVPPLEPASPTPEYWCGWILALYQWASGTSFKDIHTRLSMRELLLMYPTLHEASEWKAVETIDEAVRSKDERTNLQIRRIKASYTQKKLSDESGVNLRTLQQYESGAKNINRASGETLKALSRALCCRMEDLLETGPVEPFRRNGGLHPCGNSRILLYRGARSDPLEYQNSMSPLV